MGNSLRQLYLIVVESESDNVAAFPANRAPGHTRANAAAETNLVKGRWRGCVLNSLKIPPLYLSFNG